VQEQYEGASHCWRAVRDRKQVGNAKFGHQKRRRPLLRSGSRLPDPRYLDDLEQLFLSPGGPRNTVCRASAGAPGTQRVLQSSSHPKGLSWEAFPHPRRKYFKQQAASQTPRARVSPALAAGAWRLPGGGADSCCGRRQHGLSARLGKSPRAPSRQPRRSRRGARGVGGWPAPAPPSGCARCTS